MGIFNQKSKFRVEQEVRTVRKVIEPPRAKPKQPSGGSARPGAGKKRPDNPPASATKSRSLPPSVSNGPPGRRAHVRAGTSNNPLKRKAAPSRGRRSLPASPSCPSFGESDDDDEADDWEAHLDARKRQRRGYQQQRAEDCNRVLLHPAVWAGDQDGGTTQQQGEAEQTQTQTRPDGATGAIPPIIHAAEFASLAEGCEPALGLSPDEVAVELQYPGAKTPERYELAWGRDRIEAVKDILKVVHFVATIYLKDDENEGFLNQNSGIYRRLERSNNTGDGPGFKAALQDFNTRLRSLQRSGVVARNLGTMHGIPRELAAFMLDQIYDRTVAPKIELLAKYQNGTDNVYGELLHPFVSDILVTRTKMTSDMVFVDLGSGVGNVVLQAALEIGCESWGCEMMENACNLAEAQQREFLARCRLWGVAPGAVRLERGDFRRNEAVLAVLKRADVVLVNNQAFTAELNSNLVNMFLDLKVGCRIVSLKTFVHDNKLAENDVASSILDVEHLTYPGEYVSWTSASGTFCISTKKDFSA